VLIVAVVIGAALEVGRFSALLSEWVGLSEPAARAIVLAAAAVVGLPLVIGLTRTALRLGAELALKALPAAAAGKVDFAESPRRALAVTLQIAILGAVGIPLVAIVLPFLPSYRFALVPLAFVAIPAIAFWRSTMNLQGHTKAGAEVIAMKLGEQMSGATGDAQEDDLQNDMERVLAVAGSEEAIAAVRDLLEPSVPGGSPPPDLYASRDATASPSRTAAGTGHSPLRPASPPE
jgi:monovalent cation:H+ antiporter-2, CPA2 family